MSEETFIALLSPNLKPLRTFVQRQLRASSPVDDIVQETLLRAFTRRDQLRVPSKFKAWLWSIAMNELRMFLRSGSRTVSFTDLPRFEPSDGALSPLAACERTERKEWIAAGLATLSERESTAIRLIDFRGKSIAETAAALAISIAATKSVHFRARRHLACALRHIRTLSLVTKPRVSERTKEMTARHTKRSHFIERPGAVRLNKAKQIYPYPLGLADDCGHSLPSLPDLAAPGNAPAAVHGDRLQAA